MKNNNYNYNINNIGAMLMYNIRILYDNCVINIIILSTNIDSTSYFPSTIGVKYSSFNQFDIIYYHSLHKLYYVNFWNSLEVII